MIAVRILSKRIISNCIKTTSYCTIKSNTKNLKSINNNNITDELPLNKAMLTKLEQLSALRFQSSEEIESVEEDIRLAQKIFEVDTTGIEPLYSVVEEIINCPLREDITEITCASKALANAPVVVEDFLVVPPANIPQSENLLLDEHFRKTSGSDLL
uniref:Glu-AdT subunit C n=1 Tax=Panagrolaimus sp. PS1159 TaxID=55785 RepID=A0AC35GK31_9BILA